MDIGFTMVPKKLQLPLDRNRTRSPDKNRGPATDFMINSRAIRKLP